jgi:hypothetical protein
MRLSKPFRFAPSTIARIFSGEVSVVRTTHSARTSPAGAAARAGVGAGAGVGVGVGAGVCVLEATAETSNSNAAAAARPKVRVNFSLLDILFRGGKEKGREHFETPARRLCVGAQYW